MPARLELTPEDVVDLYTRVIEGWNARDARAFAEPFAANGSTVGYDGSQMDGRSTIESELAAIFAHHTPATYVAKVRELRPLGAGAMLLRAVVGMVPPGKDALNPERNAIQSLVAVLDDGVPRIAHFHNTPARFDGRPQLGEQLTAELTAVHRSGRVVHTI